LDGWISNHLSRVGREIIRANAGEQCCVCFAHHDYRAGQFLHLGMAASVIGVCVTVQNDFDVLYLQSKLCHALANSGHSRFKAGMEQDVTLSRGDE
jgi:hypothetical protein